jgi:nickel-dependent lactate racemase
MDAAAAKQWVQSDKTPGCRICVHDPSASPLTEYGHTSRGTPVAINAEYARADLKLLIGQIDPHQFVGFTGGAKGVVVGCASPATIEHNHGLMFEDGAEVGRLQGNPVREDLNEAGRMVGVDMAINVVLDADGKPIGLWAGEPAAVLEKGAKTCAKVYGVSISRKFDMAVVSCGGYPKDICLYQAQKGLNLASHAVKPNGKILLLAECPQGVGDDIYHEYVCQFDTAEAAMADFKNRGFKMGAHKAYLFGKTLTNHEVVIDSDMPRDVLRHCHLTAGHAQDILNRWIAEFPERPQVAVVPNANTTYFFHA